MYKSLLIPILFVLASLGLLNFSEAAPSCKTLFKQIDDLNVAIEPTDLLFGPEWTFTNEKMINASENIPSDVVNKVNQKALADWLQHLKSQQKYRFEILKDSRYGTDLIRIFDLDGWWVQISMDPGVIEVHAKPSTKETFLKKKNFIEETVFIQAKAFGLNPHRHEGSGHIHLSFSHFNTYLHFRNFLVDLYNHDFLFSQILVDKPRSGATPLSAMPAEFQRRLSNILAEVDLLQLADQQKMILLASRIQNEVYTDTIGLGISKSDAYKYQAINLSRIVDNAVDFKDKTIELRGIRPQKNLQEFFLEIEMFQKRVAYVGEFKEFITYDEVNHMGGMWDWMLFEKYEDYLKQIGLFSPTYVNLNRKR